MNEEIKELEKRLKEAEELLMFYGNSQHWSKPYVRQGKIGYQVKTPLHVDGGIKARNYLKKHRLI